MFLKLSFEIVLIAFPAGADTLAAGLEKSKYVRQLDWIWECNAISAIFLLTVSNCLVVAKLSQSCFRGLCNG